VRDERRKKKVRERKRRKEWKRLGGGGGECGVEKHRKSRAEDRAWEWRQSLGAVV
jgi:hypothetical protein